MQKMVSSCLLPSLRCRPREKKLDKGTPSMGTCALI